MNFATQFFVYKLTPYRMGIHYTKAMRIYHENGVSCSRDTLHHERFSRSLTKHAILIVQVKSKEPIG